MVASQLVLACSSTRSLIIIFKSAMDFRSLGVALDEIFIGESPTMVMRSSGVTRFSKLISHF